MENNKPKAVIGAGTMGSGIATSLALAGYKVFLFDRFLANPEIKHRAEAGIRRFLFAIRNIQKDETFKRIKFFDVDSIQDFLLMSNCDAVLEAIYENLEEKTKLYRRIWALNKVFNTKPFYIYSNTSTIQCERLVRDLEYPENFMILHFFSPVPMSKIVEFVPHGGTSEETILLGREIIEKIGKKVKPAPDIPGFVVNRILLPMLQSFGERLWQGGSASEIDEAFKTGAWINHGDARIVMEAMIKSAERLLAETQEDSVEQPPLELEAMCGGLRLNRNSGNNKVVLTSQEIDEMVVLGTGFPMGPFELKRALKEGEAANSAKLKFRMGPGQLADFVGLDIALHCLEMLKLQEPEYWHVPEVFKTLVQSKKLGIKSGEGFYQYEVSTEQVLDKNYAVVTIESSSLSHSVVKILTKVFESLKEKNLRGVILVIEKVKGADICEFPSAIGNPEFLEEVLDDWHKLIKTVRNFSTPIIAALRTLALGGGYELALACDYIVAEKKTKIGLPEIRLGILPGGGGTQNLPRKVGLEKALAMILNGEVIEASVPWVDECVDSITRDYLENILGQVSKTGHNTKQQALIKESSGASNMNWRKNSIIYPNSVDFALGSILYGITANIDDGLAKEKEAIIKAFETSDAKTGIMYFLEHAKYKFPFYINP